MVEENLPSNKDPTPPQGHVDEAYRRDIVMSISGKGELPLSRQSEK